MESYIKRIKEQAEWHGEEHLRLNNLLEEIIDNCQHQFPKEPTQNDSHHDYYRCEICGHLFSDNEIASLKQKS